MKTKLILILGIAAMGLTSCKEGASFYTNSLRSQFFVQPNTNSNYDFLWVMENSGSMKPRRDYIRDNIDMFLTTLNSRKAINYQMAVVTTDAFRDSGALVKASSGLEVEKSTSANPKAEFAEVINAITDSNTSFWEQGLENSYQAVFKYANKFSRQGVPLIVVYVTDEDDYSCKESCWGVQTENNTTWKSFDTTRYIEFFQKVKASEGSEAVLFPIVGLNAESCVVPSLGKRYEAVASAIGLYGTTGSICDLDWRKVTTTLQKSLPIEITCLFWTLPPLEKISKCMWTENPLIPSKQIILLI